MSNSINGLFTIGPKAELKNVGSTSLLSFSGVNETGFGDKKIGTWYNLSLWGKQAEALQKYIVKGKQFFIIGEFAPRPYTNKSGEEKLSMDIRVSSIDFVRGDKSDSAPAPSAPASSPETEADEPF